MEDFIKDRGIGFLAHILRRLSDQFVRDFVQWNKEMGIAAPPRTHSTMQALDERGPLSVTEVAGLVHQSHPLMITWVHQLNDLGLVDTLADPTDGRRTILRLTPAGKKDVRKQREALVLIESVFRELMEETGGDMFVQLWEVEAACRTRPVLARLREKTGGAASGAPSPPHAQHSVKD